MERVALVLAVFALFASPASATVISPERGTSYPYQRWVDSAKVPTPDITVEIFEVESATMSGCVSDFGCTALVPSPRIWLKTGLPRVLTKRVFFHELGHSYDYFSLSNEDRAVITGLLGAWDAEAFPEIYRLCALSWRHHREGPYAELLPLSRAAMASACYALRH